MTRQRLPNRRPAETVELEHNGSRFTVTTGVDNALSGMPGQRPIQVLDDPYGDGSATASEGWSSDPGPDAGP